MQIQYMLHQVTDDKTNGLFPFIAAPSPYCALISKVYLSKLNFVACTSGAATRAKNLQVIVDSIA